MDVELLSLCDAATEHAGKIFVIGVFDRIFAPAAPIMAPPCAIAARIRFMKLEEGAKNFRLGFVDADGKEVIPTLNAQIPVVIPPNESSATAQFVVGIQQLRLPSFGDYQIDLAIDGRVEKSIPLFVRQLPAQPPQLQNPQPGPA